MFRTIKDKLQNRHDSDGSTGNEYPIRLATAALLVEMTRADSEIFVEEEEVVFDSLRKTFSLSKSETEELISVAETDVDDAIDMYSYTKLLNEHLSLEEKEKVIELLWRVVYADGVKDQHEEYMVRKIADLLYIPHHSFIETRQRVEKELAS